MDLCEFEASVVYRVNAVQLRIHSETLSKKLINRERKEKERGYTYTCKSFETSYVMLEYVDNF